MQMKGALVAFALVAFASLALIPVAFAHPINPNLTWSPNPVTTPGATTTATYGVATDSDCPSGQTFTGTLTVVEPDGVSTAKVTVAATACGTTNLNSVYPTGFTGTASTLTCGVYSATWAGTTSALVGGFHPTFSVTNNFVVTCTTTAPEFASPAILVGAIGLVAIVALRKTKFVKV
jgi:hypothetical protein